MCAYKVHDIYRYGSSGVRSDRHRKTGKGSLPLRSNDMKIWSWKHQARITTLSLKLKFSPQGATVSKWQSRAKIGPKNDVRIIKSRKGPAHLMIHGNYNVLSGVSLVDTTKNDDKEDDIGSEH